MAATAHRHHRSYAMVTRSAATQETEEGRSKDCVKLARRCLRAGHAPMLFVRFPTKTYSDAPRREDDEFFAVKWHEERRQLAVCPYDDAERSPPTPTQIINIEWVTGHVCPQCPLNEK